jgi:sortase A
VRALKVAEYVLTAAGALLLGYCAAEFVDSRFFEFRQAQKFAQELRTAPPRSAAPLPAMPPPRDGAVMGRLEIPRLGVSVMVVEGVDEGDLNRAAGHIPGTAFPGQAGNVGIAAHRDTFFRALRNVKADDTISLQTLRGTYRYRVVSTTIVNPDDVRVLDPTGGSTLTLVTCYPFYYIGAAPRRFIVHAQLLAPASSTRPQS